MAMPPPPSSPPAPTDLATAMALHQRSQWAAADRAYRAFLQHSPENPDALALHGLVLSELKQHQAAIAQINRALQHDSATPLFHFHLGNAYAKADEPALAAASFQAAITRAPGWGEPYYNLGNAYHAQNKDDAAKQAYEQALALQPDHPLACSNLASLLLKEGKAAAARDVAERGLARHPEHISLLLTRNAIAFEQNDIPTASITAQQVAELKLGLKGDALITALHNIETIDTADPDIANSLFALGVSLLLQGAGKLASFILRSLMAAEPDSGECAAMLGSTALNQNQLAMADQAYSMAFMLRPSMAAAPWNRSMPLLTQGNLVDGFNRYRWRWQALEKFKKMRLHARMWDGSDPHGKTLAVHEEQGFGDSLQMLRFVPLLRARGAVVHVYARPVLYALLENWQGADQVVCWHVEDKTVPATVDYSCGLMDLAGFSGATLATLPAQTPYLPNPLAAAPRLQLPPSQGLKIALNWCGNPQHKRDHERSIAATLLEPLLACSGATFYSIQHSPKAEDKAWLHRHNITDLGSQTKNLAEAAAYLAQMDLLITVDSAPAHLAGALGVPVWTLVTFNPDWRWLLGRDDSPWYPSLRLFRQQQPGDWLRVMEAVAKALQEKLRGASPSDSSGHAAAKQIVQPCAP